LTCLHLILSLFKFLQLSKENKRFLIFLFICTALDSLIELFYNCLHFKKLNCGGQTTDKTKFALGPIHKRHFEIQYCDKKIFFNQYFFLLCESKIFISVYLIRFWNVTTIFWQQKCLFIFLSQYCVPKCLMWIRP